LQLQFTTGRTTPFTGISRVLPGEALLARGGKVVDRRRRTPLPGLAPIRIGEAEGVARLRDALCSVVQAISLRGVQAAFHLRPSVGCAALTAAMVETGVKPAMVVSVVPQSTKPAERPQTVVQDYLDTEYATVEVMPEDIWRDLPRMVGALDDPAADYSMIPTYLAAARVAQDLKALISDDGADEIFAGYGRYRAVTRWFWLGGRAMRSRGFLEGFGILRDETSRWRDGIVAVERRIAEEPFTKLQAAQALDSTDWLAHDVMLRLDRANQAHGVETQTPFLEEVVAHFGFRLPDSLKVSGGKGAHLLRRYISSVIPKVGASFDRQRISWLEPWLPTYAARLAEPLSSLECIREYCHSEAVALLLKRCTSASNRRILNAVWQLVFFALWHRIHIEGVDAEGDTLETLMAK
jgi:asparagine synthase (glutamine-hydrolysing)